MTNIVLCGGSGTRLWPVSREKLPKQFVRLTGTRSLFQDTVERNRAGCGETFVVANDDHYFLAKDQLEEAGPATGEERYLLEPAGRNTAPAIALACLALAPEEIVLVTPSDHVIRERDAYREVLKAAERFAGEGFLVTFGITPESPETGYGYIQAEGNRVLSFKEKPDLETAKGYLAAGGYYWNSGMFCFRAGTFLEELERHAPEILAACRKALEGKTGEREIRIDPEAMAAIPSESIDYAVMEKSEKVRVVPAKIGWNDMGSFDALAMELEKDGNGNACWNTAGNTAPIAVDARNNLLLSEDRLIAAVDVEDLIVVDTPDALLVTKKGSSQKVREVVKELKSGDGELHEIHQTAHRPWGTYSVLEGNRGYKIKRIVVKPGKRLSLQKHFHRSEHWIVVSGTAKVTLGDEETLVRANESTYIPMGQLHRLENPGKIDLVLIEVQVGQYLGEDDIVRVEDDYRR